MFIETLTSTLHEYFELEIDYMHRMLGISAFLKTDKGIVYLTGIAQSLAQSACGLCDWVPER